MMLQERRQDIIDIIKKDRMIKTSDLVNRYDVSVETIRRDLEYLESTGQLRRVYGGAVVSGLYGQEPMYSHRQVVNYEAKCIIGQKAAELINDGDTLFFDVGTTALEVAKNLKNKKNLTVITHATLIAQEMMQFGNADVILLGGNLRAGELSVSGSLTIQGLEHFYANKLVMGVGGINAENGITDYHTEEAEIRRIMIRHSDKIIAVTDSSKFGVTAMNYIAPLSVLDDIVVDNTIKTEDINHLRESDIKVTIAK